MLGPLQDFLQGHWSQFFPGREPGRKIRLLGVRGSLEGGKVIFFVFADSSPRPACVAKVLRNEACFEKMRCAYEVLQSFARVSALSDKVPRALALERIADTWVLLESFTDGSPIPLTVGADGLPKPAQARFSLDRAFEFLELLHNKIARPVVLMGEVSRTVMEPLLKRAQSSLSLTQAEQVLIGLLHAELERMKDLKVRPVLAHGDFCRHNVIIHCGHARVLDWDVSSEGLPPLFDGLNFCLTFLLQLTGPKRAFHCTFLERNGFSQMVKQKIQQLAARTEVPMQLLPTLFVGSLVDRVCGEAELFENWEREGFLPMSAHASKLGVGGPGREDDGWQRPFRTMFSELAAYYAAHGKLGVF